MKLPVKNRKLLFLQQEQLDHCRSASYTFQHLRRTWRTFLRTNKIQKRRCQESCIENLMGNYTWFLIKETNPNNYN